MSFRKDQWVPLFILIISAFSGTASAAVYTDATGEQFNPGDTHLDISSVEVTNDATNLRFEVGLVGNPTSPDWGKYMIGIDSAEGGTSTTNGWARPISMSGMDHWVGSWLDTAPPGAEVWRFASTWSKAATTYGEGAPLAAPIADGNSLTLTIPLALLGLEHGDTFVFDVYTSGGGGGDSAIDASSNPDRAAGDWGVAYDSGENVSSYTVIIPEPTSLGMLAVAATVLLARRRK